MCPIESQGDANIAQTKKKGRRGNKRKGPLVALTSINCRLGSPSSREAPLYNVTAHSVRVAFWRVITGMPFAVSDDDGKEKNDKTTASVTARRWLNSRSPILEAGRVPRTTPQGCAHIVPSMRHNNHEGGDGTILRRKRNVLRPKF